jgi:hypothetical protein
MATHSIVSNVLHPSNLAASILYTSLQSGDWTFTCFLQAQTLPCFQRVLYSSSPSPSAASAYFARMSFHWRYQNTLTNIS